MVWDYHNETSENNLLFFLGWWINLLCNKYLVYDGRKAGKTLAPIKLKTLKSGNCYVKDSWQQSARVCVLEVGQLVEL